MRKRFRATFIKPHILALMMNHILEVKKTVDGIQFEIISHTITEITDFEVDNIINIIFEELENVSDRTGYIIARRIVEEINNEICTAQVDGGTDGRNWLIKISNDPLEFLG